MTNPRPITQWEAIYILTSAMRDHFKASENELSRDILPSDTLGGLLTQIEEAVGAQQK